MHVVDRVKVRALGKGALEGEDGGDEVRAVVVVGVVGGDNGGGGGGGGGDERAGLAEVEEADQACVGWSDGGWVDVCLEVKCTIVSYGRTDARCVPL